jgi:hypothetical protein
MRCVGIAALALALPSLADARPITFGVGLGRTQSKVDADANGTQQLFGRVAFTPRLAGQLELQGIDDPSMNIRTATVLLVVELGSMGKLVPLLVAGFGYGHASSDWGTETSGTHKEGGFGLEYRADGGLTLGVDLRLGGRSIDQGGEVPVATGEIALYAPPGLVAGEYRSGRLYVGIRF